jgi:hypothetical protein
MQMGMMETDLLSEIKTGNVVGFPFPHESFNKNEIKIFLHAISYHSFISRGVIFWLKLFIYNAKNANHSGIERWKQIHYTPV